METNMPTQNPIAVPKSPSKWLKRTHFSNDIDVKKIKVLVHGAPKSGKTTFLGTWPGLFVIDADNGLVTLRRKRIPGWTPEKGGTTYKDVMDLLLDIKMKRNGFGPGEEFGDIETLGSTR